MLVWLVDHRVEFRVCICLIIFGVSYIYGILVVGWISRTISITDRISYVYGGSNVRETRNVLNGWVSGFLVEWDSELYTGSIFWVLYAVILLSVEFLG